MSSCEDDLETSLTMANDAIRKLFEVCPTDELLKPVMEPGVHGELWAQFRERFGNKSDLWKNHPACAQAVFWQNYANAVNARAEELERTMQASLF